MFMLPDSAQNKSQHFEIVHSVVGLSTLPISISRSVSRRSLLCFQNTVREVFNFAAARWTHHPALNLALLSSSCFNNLESFNWQALAFQKTVEPQRVQCVLVMFSAVHPVFLKAESFLQTRRSRLEAMGAKRKTSGGGDSGAKALKSTASSSTVDVGGPVQLFRTWLPLCLRFSLLVRAGAKNVASSHHPPWFQVGHFGQTRDH